MQNNIPPPPPPEIKWSVPYSFIYLRPENSGYNGQSSGIMRACVRACVRVCYVRACVCEHENSKNNESIRHDNSKNNESISLKLNTW